MNKLTRYNLAEIARTYSSDKHRIFCTAYDVAKLEAMNAELLEALEKALDALGGNDPHDLGYDDSICGYIRAAIAKVKGEML